MSDQIWPQTWHIILQQINIPSATQWLQHCASAWELDNKIDQGRATDMDNHAKLCYLQHEQGDLFVHIQVKIFQRVPPI